MIRSGELSLFLAKPTQSRVVDVILAHLLDIKLKQWDNNVILKKCEVT